jgi:hypothetical protein
MDPSNESTDQEGEHSDPGNAEPTKSLPRSVVIFPPHRTSRPATGPLLRSLALACGGGGRRSGIKCHVLVLGGNGTRLSVTAHAVRVSLSSVLGAKADTVQPLVAARSRCDGRDLRSGVFRAGRVDEVCASAVGSGTVEVGLSVLRRLLNAGQVIDCSRRGPCEAEPVWWAGCCDAALLPAPDAPAFPGRYAAVWRRRRLSRCLRSESILTVSTLTSNSSSGSNGMAVVWRACPG